MSEPPLSAAASDTKPPRVRVFCDATGIEWRVTEQRFPDYDRRQGASLIFSSDGVVRRVRDFPPNWDSLDIEALLRLSWNV